MLKTKGDLLRWMYLDLIDKSELPTIICAVPLRMLEKLYVRPTAKRKKSISAGVSKRTQSQLLSMKKVRRSSGRVSEYASSVRLHYCAVTRKYNGKEHFIGLFHFSSTGAIYITSYCG